MRILILMSDTGGGHRSSALALQQEFAHWLPGKHQVTFIDFYRNMAPWPFNAFPDIYPVLINRWPFIWKAIFDNYGSRVSEEFMARLLKDYCQPYFDLLVSLYRPDLIVTVNPLVCPVLFRVAEALKLDIPVVALVSDLIVPHCSWFHRKQIRCFVPTPQAALAAQRSGVETRNIRVYGLPVRREFLQVGAEDKKDLRKLLGFAGEVPLILLMGGGEGTGTLTSLVTRTAEAVQQKSLPPVQLAVVCGRNQALQKRLGAMSLSGVRVLGYIENMHDWMAASDCVITKAGPNTIMEAATLGVPIILSGYVPGQEEHNPAFVLRHGMGIFEKDPDKQLNVLQEWIQEDSLRQELISNALAAAQPQAGQNIVLDLDRSFS